MKQNFEKSLEMVLEHEGGFSDHPSDPGGATMRGVTLHTFRRYFGRDKTVEELKAITQEQISKIYHSGYWLRCKCDQLPGGIDYAMFDAAVNSGPGRSAKWLQIAVGAVRDGVIGKNTLHSVAINHNDTTINSMCDHRLKFLKRLSTFATFGRGWSARVRKVRRVATAMAHT